MIVEKKINIKIILLNICELKDKDYAIGSQSVNTNELQLRCLLKALEFGNGTAVRFSHKRGKIVGEDNGNLLVYAQILINFK